MIRKQIYISDELDRKIKVFSGLKGIGNSEIIRNALDNYLSQNFVPQTAWYKQGENGGFYFSHMESGHSNKLPSTTNTWVKLLGYMIGKDFYDTHGNHFKLSYKSEDSGVFQSVLR